MVYGIDMDGIKIKYDVFCCKNRIKLNKVY